MTRRSVVICFSVRPGSSAPRIWPRHRPPRLTLISRPPGRGGTDFRGTFVNLASRTHGVAAACRARRPGADGRAGAPETPDRANWYRPLKVFDNSTGWARVSIPPGRSRPAPGYHHRHELRLATDPGQIVDGLRSGPESRDLEHVDNQPRARRPRPRRRGIAEALRRKGRDRPARLGVHSSSGPATAAGGVPRATSWWGRTA